MTTLKFLPPADRPREKMLRLGASALTTTELLMIILSSGSQRASVEQLAKKIQTLFKNKKNPRVEDFTAIRGIGVAKACQLLSSIELAERLYPREPEVVLNSVEKILPFLSELRNLSREHIIGLYLNARMKLIHKELLSVGSLNQAVISPRDVFSPIKQHPVAYLLLAHNHPSGDPTPSQEDYQFTDRISSGCRLLGLELLDHVIVTPTAAYSFKQSRKF